MEIHPDVLLSADIHDITHALHIHIAHTDKGVLIVDFLQRFQQGLHIRFRLPADHNGQSLQGLEVPFHLFGDRVPALYRHMGKIPGGLQVLLVQHERNVIGPKCQQRGQNNPHDPHGPPELPFNPFHPFTSRSRFESDTTLFYLILPSPSTFFSWFRQPATLLLSPPGLWKFPLDRPPFPCYTRPRIPAGRMSVPAALAHLVERHLAKVEVASSPASSRSHSKSPAFRLGIFHTAPVIPPLRPKSRGAWRCSLVNALPALTLAAGFSRVCGCSIHLRKKRFRVYFAHPDNKGPEMQVNFRSLLFAMEASGHAGRGPK